MIKRRKKRREGRRIEERERQVEGRQAEISGEVVAEGGMEVGGMEVGMEEGGRRMGDSNSNYTQCLTKSTTILPLYKFKQTTILAAVPFLSCHYSWEQRTLTSRETADRETVYTDQ